MEDIEHIHDQLNYLKYYEIINLNDKYLRDFLDLEKDQIIALCDTYNNLLIKNRNMEREVKVLIQIEKNRYLPIYVQEVHLYLLIINCLEEIYERKFKGVEDDK